MDDIFTWVESNLRAEIAILTALVLGLATRRDDVRAFAKWSKENVGLWVSAAIGMFIGVTFAWHEGDKPSEAYAALFGAFVGIVAAVGGAVWLWRIQDEAQVRRSMASVTGACDYLSAGLFRLFDAMAPENLKDRGRSSTDVLSDYLKRFFDRARRYEHHLLELPDRHQLAYRILEEKLDILQKCIARFQGAAAGFGDGRLGPNLMGQIASAAIDVRNCISVMSSELELLSPMYTMQWRRLGAGA